MNSQNDKSQTNCLLTNLTKRKNLEKVCHTQRSGVERNNGNDNSK